MNTIEEIIWHDGVLLDFKIIFETSISIVLTMMVFESKKTMMRKKVKLTFTHVDNIVCSADSYEIIDSLKSGNISNGYIKKNKVKEDWKFFLYLLDGIISFHFTSVEKSK